MENFFNKVDSMVSKYHCGLVLRYHLGHEASFLVHDRLGMHIIVFEMSRCINVRVCERLCLHVCDSA